MTGIYSEPWADGLDRFGQVVWTFPVPRAGALIDNERAETRACAVSRKLDEATGMAKSIPKPFPPE